MGIRSAVFPDLLAPRAQRSSLLINVRILNVSHSHSCRIVYTLAPECSLGSSAHYELVILGFLLYKFVSIRSSRRLKMYSVVVTFPVPGNSFVYEDTSVINTYDTYASANAVAQDLAEDAYYQGTRECVSIIGPEGTVPISY